MFLAVCVGFVVVVLALQARFVLRERALKTTSWDQLLGRVEHMDVDGLRQIADCYLDPTTEQLRIEPGVMWSTVGGLAGICRLEENARAMLDLAMYAERWHDLNGPVISELLRRDAARIRKAVRKIQFSMLTRRGLVYIGFELQEAIASYCLMRARLLGMYGECHAGLLPRLAEAV